MALLIYWKNQKSGRFQKYPNAKTMKFHKKLKKKANRSSINTFCGQKHVKKSYNSKHD